MTLNIVEAAITEAGNYLNKLNTSKIFKMITEHYIKLHNKGIFVNFSFNSADASGLFNSFAYRYGFKINIPINNAFNRMKVVRLSDIERKLDTQLKTLRDKKELYRKVSHRHVETLDKLKIERHKEIDLMADSEPRIAIAYQNGDSLNFAHLLMETQINEIQKQINNKYKSRLGLMKIRENVRYIEKDLKHVEQEIFKLVLKKYISIVEKYTRDLFQTKEVYVIYYEKEWLERYTKDRERKLNEMTNSNGMSKIENFMLDFIKDNFNMFHLKVNDKEYSYSIDSKSTNTSLKRVPPEVYRDYDYWNTKLQEFTKEYPEFMAIVRLQNDITLTVGKAEASASILLRYTFEKFPNEIIDKYNFILEQRKNVKNGQMNQRPVYKEFPTLQQTFPELHFVVHKERDFGYWVAVKEEKFNDVLCSISNEEYFLELYDIEKNKELEMRLFGKK